MSDIEGLKKSVQEQIEYKKQKAIDRKWTPSEYLKHVITSSAKHFIAMRGKATANIIADTAITLLNKNSFPSKKLNLQFEVSSKNKKNINEGVNINENEKKMLIALMKEFEEKVQVILPAFEELTNQIQTNEEAYKFSMVLFQTCCKKQLAELGIKDDSFTALINNYNELKEKIKDVQEKVTGKRFVEPEEFVSNSIYYETPEYEKFKQGSLGDYNFLVVNEYPADDKIKRGTIYILQKDGKLVSSKTQRLERDTVIERDVSKLMSIKIFLNENPTAIISGMELPIDLKSFIYNNLSSVEGVLPQLKNTIYSNKEVFAFNEFISKFDRLTPIEIREQWQQFRADYKSKGLEEGKLKLNTTIPINNSIQDIIDDPNLTLEINSTERKNLKEILLEVQKEVNADLKDLPRIKTDKTRVMVSLPLRSIVPIVNAEPAPTTATVSANKIVENYEEIHAAAKEILVDDTTEFMKEYMEFSDLINNNQNNKNNDVIQKKCAELLTKVAPKDPKEVHFNLTNKKRRNELITQLEKSPPETGALLKALSEVYISDLRPSLLSDKTRKLPDSIENFVQIVNDKITKDATLFSSANLSTPSSAAQSSTVPTTTIFPTTQQPIGITPQSAAANLESEQAAALIPPPPATVTFSVPKRTHQRSASMPNIIVPGSKAEKLLVGRRNSVGGETEVPNKAKKLLGDTPPAGTTDKARKFFGIEAPTSSPLKTLIDPSISLDKLPEDRPRGKKP